MKIPLHHRVLWAFCRGVVLFVSRLLWRVKVVGREHIPAGPFVLAPVHRSNVDSLVTPAVTRRRMRYMGKDTMWKFSLPGRLFTALGGFPVHRGTADRDALRKCIDVVEAGEPLVIFPEGTRQSGPEVQPLFEGAAYVAARTGVSIVPVGIGGSERIMPKGSKMVRTGRVVIVIGEPIAPPVAAGGSRLPRRAVHELTMTLHQRLQAVFDEARRLAG